MGALAPGYELEAAVVGDDLVVANHGTGMDEALGAHTATSSHALAADPRWIELRRRLQPAPGSLVLFADWRRFGPRLASALGGLPGFLLDGSGIGQADAVIASLAPRQQDLQATVLLAFAPGSPIDGWLSLVEPAPARQLLDELPAGEPGGLVLAVDCKRLAQSGEAAMPFARQVAGGCGECGLELERIARRLGHRGAMQLAWRPGAGLADLSVAPVFTVQAQSHKVANEVFDEIARAAQERRRGRAIKSSERGVQQLELLLGGPAEGRGPGPARGPVPPDRGPPDRGPTGGGAPGPNHHPRGRWPIDRLRVAAVDDLLVFAQDGAAVDAVVAERRAQSRTRARRDGAMNAALAAFGADKVGGLVHFDTSTWFDAVRKGSPRTGADERAIELPSRHSGCLDVQESSGGLGAVVRLQLLSSR
jgi:hypothetical protein